MIAMPRRTFLAVLACAAPVLAQGIQWTPSFDEALAAAKAGNRVLMLAFNLAGERASDEMVADHCKDPLLARLSQQTVNVFCSIAAEPRVAGVTPAQQQAAEQAARLQVLKIGPGEDVIAPQHVFVGPDGTVLSAVSYRITKGELEWAWVDAIKKVTPDFAWQLSAAARAPARLGFGAADRGQNQEPPTKAQVEAALKELRKARGGLLRGLQHIELLMRSDEPEAMQYVQSTLKGLQPEFARPGIDTMGLVSPKAYHTVITPYLADRDDDLRIAAAGALERLAEPKAFAALLKQVKAEKVAEVRGRLLRALASSGPTQKDTLQQIDKALTKDPSDTVRAQAVLALALVEDKAKVRSGLEDALHDKSPKVRATVACALAARREAEFVNKLGEAVAAEEDAETKAWLEAALQVLRGGDGKAFENFTTRVLGDKQPRAGLGGANGR